MKKKIEVKPFGKKVQKNHHNSFVDSNGKPKLTLIRTELQTIMDGNTTLSGMWLSEEVIRYIYNESSVNSNLLFRKREPPIRCGRAIEELTVQLTSHLRLTRSRVSNMSVKSTVIYFVKHISRLKWHSKLGIKFKAHESYWKEVKGKRRHNVSYSYFMELLTMLENSGRLIKLIGWGVDDCTIDNITSMFIPNEGLINLCVGKNTPKVMESSLKEHTGNSFIMRMRVPDPKGIKKFIKIERPLKRGEIMQAETVTEAMNLFGDHIAKYSINMNGVYLPEIWFHRTYLGDFSHGGRLCCGAIQNRSKADRDTITFDGEPSVTWDFIAMHLSLAAELEGWIMGDHNPYETSIDLNVDEVAIQDHMDLYYLENYTPERNICKQAVNILLNALDRESAVKAISQALYKDLIKVNQATRKFVGLNMKGKIVALVDDLIKHNHKVKTYFHNDSGLRLQNYESSIAQLIVDTFIEENKIVLPVHDSATTKLVDSELCSRVMKESYLKVMGSDNNCKLSRE